MTRASNIGFPKFPEAKKQKLLIESLIERVNYEENNKKEENETKINEFLPMADVTVVFYGFKKFYIVRGKFIFHGSFYYGVSTDIGYFFVFILF